MLQVRPLLANLGITDFNQDGLVLSSCRGGRLTQSSPLKSQAVTVIKLEGSSSSSAQAFQRIRKAWPFGFSLFVVRIRVLLVTRIKGLIPDISKGSLSNHKPSPSDFT
jgi:hypothetical protein